MSSFSFSHRHYSQSYLEANNEKLLSITHETTNITCRLLFSSTWVRLCKLKVVKEYSSFNEMMTATNRKGKSGQPSTFVLLCLLVFSSPLRGILELDSNYCNY